MSKEQQTQLATVWPTVKAILSDGMSIIPVRDKKDGVFLPKTPYSGWKVYQTEQITEGDLFTLMVKNDTAAIAAICGKISGNLEVIDIDVKYKQGVSAIIFQAIMDIRPDLWEKLRIHETPSGGFHILYRIADKEPEGNRKLAGRVKSEDEIQAEISAGKKRPQKTVNFIETRGEGGYFLLPPSMGYTVYTKRKIPVISWADRCDLISICESLDEVVKEAKTYTVKKSESNFYKITPWDDYNQKTDICSILEESGWKRLKSTHGGYIHFTRPDKDRGISGSVNAETARFKAFTSSTDLDHDCTYSAVDLLCAIRFNLDRSATFSYLVANGFGQIKENIERGMVKKAVVSGRSLPKNLSETALKTFADLKAKFDEHLPFGSFWEEDKEKDGKYIISRQRFYEVAKELGFRLYKGVDIARINGSIVERYTENGFYNQMKHYVFEEDLEAEIAIFNALEAFFQKSGRFSIGRMDDIDESLIMKDGRYHAYKFYRNCFIKITADSIEVNSYENVEGLILQDNIQNRDWTDNEPEYNLYEDYLTRSTGFSDYVKRIIGWLSHDFKIENEAYLIVMTEKVPDPKDGGGSGKNIFGNILSSVTTVKTVAATQISFNEKFLQPWNYQRIYFLADLPKRIDWQFLKEMAGGVGMLKKLFRDETEVPSTDMPKLLMNTNYSYDEQDGGVKRRIRAIEFNDYYTVMGGVDAVHGKIFPRDFDQDDWSAFDHTIARCIQEILKAGGKIEKVDLSETGWRKQFDMKYGKHTYQWIEDSIEGWISMGDVPNQTIKESYAEFVSDIDIPVKYQISFEKRKDAISDWCESKDMYVMPFHKKVNGLAKRGLSFVKEGENSGDDPDPFKFS